jgi:hypothetical protein
MIEKLSVHTLVYRFVVRSWVSHEGNRFKLFDNPTSKREVLETMEYLTREKTRNSKSEEERKRSGKKGKKQVTSC